MTLTDVGTAAPRSDINADVEPARPGEFATPSIGPFRLETPVILAPMAGVTDVPFRELCRSFGAGIYVNQMITARALIEGNETTWKLAEFGPDESPRSIQLYGTEERSIGEAVTRLVAEGRVDHIDMNFGCPAPKVTRLGGGSALPVKRRLLRKMIEAAVKAAGDVPVTIKFRKGIDDDHLTFLDTGAMAAELGCAAIALHGRTARDLYSGHADWDAIGELKSHVTEIPVFGNGDIWEPWDALRMMRHTGCDGVVIGRGCLGRPWLFRDLAAVFRGEEPPMPPSLPDVGRIMIEHASKLVDWYGDSAQVRQFRKHAIWYVTGFPVGGARRARLAQIDSIAELESIVADFPAAEFPAEALRVKRSHTGGPKRVVLPDGWLDDIDDETPLPAEAGEHNSGG
ncbi:MAG: tRNA dihydrouridine synthase DusB [Acidimicrobiales bacterium]|nr:tRNA dihydrouridine synthase DusB [Acidimicrobiales bacterium]